MDQVSFDLPGSNIFVLNGQTLLLQNNSVIPQNMNGDLLQDELFAKECVPKQMITETEGMQESTFEGGGFVIVKGKENDCNLIQLTVQEAADLGIQFSVDNTPKNTCIMDVQSKNSNLIFQKVDADDKGAESTNTVNFITTENVNDINKMPFVNKGLNEFTLVPQYVNGQIAYAVQLTGSEQIQTAQSIGIPISVPTLGVPTVTPTENDFPKFVAPVELKTNVNDANKKTDISRNCASIQSYVPNPKIRILTKVKHQELKKLNHRKVLPVGKEKNVDRLRKLSSQKSSLSKNGKKIVGNKLFRSNTVEHTDPSKQILSTNEQNTLLNQPLPKVFKKNVEENGINSWESIKTTLPHPSSISESNTTSNKTEDIPVPQGSKISKKIITVPTDKSGRKLTPSQLMQIAAVLQKNRLKRPSDISNSSTLYDLETNTRIICRVLYPEDFTSELEKTPAVTGTTKKKGRPLKKEPGKSGKEEKPDKGKVEKGADRVPARTRSGRVTRPPRHMVEDYKRLKGDDSDETYSDYLSETDDNIENSPAINLLPGLNIQQKRNVSSQFRCPTCNKIYLGHVKMALHFTKYPDHCDSKQLELLKESAAVNEDFESGSGEVRKSTLRKGLVSKGRGRPQRKMLRRLSLEKVLDSYNENEVKRICGRRVASMFSTWEMLLLRLQSKDHEGKCKVQAFLDELDCLVKSVKAVSQHILRQPDCEQPDIQLADDTICSMLGVEKGWYCSDDGGLPNPLPIKEQTISKHVNQRIDYDDCTTPSVTETHPQLCKDEQDVVKVKEELSELDLLCVQDDPIGVDSVDQIVSERLKTMAPVDDLVPTLPAIPATSTDELVRGLLTDDLINSLETLIPPTHPPPDLDFTVLSTGFSTPR